MRNVFSRRPLPSKGCEIGSVYYLLALQSGGRDKNSMIVTFFESFKYVGHLFPVVVLRVYIGLYFLGTAYGKYDGDFLFRPRLAATINEFLPMSDAPFWYQRFVEALVIPNWQLFAYVLTYCEFLIGLSFVLGFLVRPLALLGLVMSLNYVYTTSPAVSGMYQAYVVIFLVLAWLGAGRCLGFDYYFFKRQRGIWW